MTTAPPPGRGDVGPDDEEEGLAAERTALAWGRTSLSLMACGAVVVRGLPTVTGERGRPLVGGVIVALAALLWVQSLWNEHERRLALAHDNPGAEAAALRNLAVTTVAIGLVGMAAVVLL
ncbi:MAG TPA: DUF202 domain-containing protein [Acidimicrobiales bacterium]|nr:DUF202 domain-containing protein [Acidimicrobiales bacterium]